MGYKDISGQKFGRLTAIRYDHKGASNRAYWLFRCDCGKEKIICSNTVTKKNAEVKSCGCLNDEVRKSGSNGRVHGGSGTRLYTIWINMKGRCNNKNDKSYKKWYGSRGISVCEEWRNDFSAFRRWALQNGYRDNLSIDRRDPDGDYCPENCRWSDGHTQAINKSNIRMLEYNGQRHTEAEWAEILDINPTTIRSRVHYGWTVEETLCVPPGVRRKVWRQYAKTPKIRDSSET